MNESVVEPARSTKECEYEEPFSLLDHPFHVFNLLRPTKFADFDHSTTLHVVQNALSPQESRIPSSKRYKMVISREPVSLMDIPNELLYQTLEGIQDENVLYSLSLLCRRLHYCALPIYLSRFGIPDALNLSMKGEVMLFDHRCEHVLKGLWVALFLTSIKRLICTFQFPETRLAWEVRSLHRLCAKLSHIDEVVFDFYDLSWWLGPEYYQVDLAEWKKAFGRSIYNIVIAKSCTVLTVRHGGIFSRTNPPRRKLAGTIQRKGTAFATFKKKFRKKNSLDANFAGHSQLSSSLSFFSKYMVGWALNASSITTFALEDTYLFSDDFSHALADIDMPALIQLSLDARGIKFADLSKFLVRHPEIINLRLGQPFHDFASQSHLPLAALPKLRTLDAPLPCITFFLKENDRFLALTSVTVSSILTFETNFADTCHAFKFVVHRINKLSLSLRLCVVDPHWFYAGNRPDSIICCGLYRMSSLELLGAEWSWRQLTLLSSWLTLCPMLTRLSVLHLNVQAKWEGLGMVEFIQSLEQTCVATAEINGREHLINRRFSPP